MKDKASKPAVKAIPTGFHTLTPHLVCKDAPKAIEFYKKAFGAKEISVLESPDGKLMHAEVKIGNSILMIADVYEGMNQDPKGLGGTPVTIHMYVKDADKTYSQAIKAGATESMPIMDMFWGDRYGIVTDPWGHSWSIATHTQDLSEEQIMKNAAKAFAEGGNCG